MSTPTEILSLERIGLPELPPHDTALEDFSLSLSPGELVTILLDPIRFRTPIPDIACGLIEPESGKACFLDRDWSRRLPGGAARDRGKIGHVFDKHAWVSNLNVDENVILPHMHHCRGSERELCERATALGVHFGLPSLPETRPVATKAADLKRAQCVRAFLGEPALLILERPTYGIYPDLHEALLQSIQEARQRGAAVLWLESVPDPFDHPDVNATAQYKMDGARLSRLPASGAAGDGKGGGSAQLTPPA